MTTDNDYSDGMPNDWVCPSCGETEWYDDYPAPDVRFSYCERCDWPQPTPMSPDEWRADPRNPLNKRTEEDE